MLIDLACDWNLPFLVTFAIAVSLFLLHAIPYSFFTDKVVHIKWLGIPIAIYPTSFPIFYWGSSRCRDYELDGFTFGFFFIGLFINQSLFMVLLDRFDFKGLLSESRAEYLATIFLSLPLIGPLIALSWLLVSTEKQELAGVNKRIEERWVRRHYGTIFYIFLTSGIMVIFGTIISSVN